MHSLIVFLQDDLTHKYIVPRPFRLVLSTRALYYPSGKLSHHPAQQNCVFRNLTSLLTVIADITVTSLSAVSKSSINGKSAALLNLMSNSPEDYFQGDSVRRTTH